MKRFALPFALAICLLPAAGMAQEKPAKFIKQVIEGNLAEIQVGQLAEKQASSADVKTFAQQLVTDHQAANDKATALAKQAGIPAPEQTGKREQAMLTKLEKLKGAEFDKAFATDMVEDHERTIRLFEAEAKGTGPTADFAKKTLPILQKHLDAAKNLKTGS